MMAGSFNVQMQVMWNRLISVVEEQAMTLLRTAFSTSVREAGDHSAGVYSPDGRMLAQAVTGTLGHVNTISESVRHFLNEIPVDEMFEGDCYATNDPWRGKKGCLPKSGMENLLKMMCGFKECNAAKMLRPSI